MKARRGIMEIEIYRCVCAKSNNLVIGIEKIAGLQIKSRVGISPPD
jgi:hypothetical protein